MKKVKANRILSNLLCAMLIISCVQFAGFSAVRANEVQNAEKELATKTDIFEADKGEVNEGFAEGGSFGLSASGVDRGSASRANGSSSSGGGSANGVGPSGGVYGSYLNEGAVRISQSKAANTGVIYHRGVNMSGPESSAGTVGDKLGQHYTFGEEKSYRYFASKGFDIVRLPVLWERIMPTPSGALNEEYMQGIRDNIAWADKYGMQIVIDIHSFGRFRDPDTKREHTIDVDTGSSWDVTTEDFVNLWLALSDEFKDNDAIYGYDIMNEPFNMNGLDDDTQYTETTVSNWHYTSNEVVKALRANGDDTLVIVEGNHWANAHNWEHWNGTDGPWIDDPINNTMYSAHTYFDHNASGTYTKTFDEELAAYLEKDPVNGYENFLNIGVKRVSDFGEWCKKWNVRGFMGEFASPHRDDCAYGTGEADTRWNLVLERFMDALDYYQMDATYWSAGIWWGSQEKMNIYPYDRDEENPKQDAVQVNILQQHLSNGMPKALNSGEPVVFYPEKSVLSGAGDETDVKNIISYAGTNTSMMLRYSSSEDASISVYVQDALAGTFLLPSTGGQITSLYLDTHIAINKNKNTMTLVLTDDKTVNIDFIMLTSLKYEAEDAQYSDNDANMKIPGLNSSSSSMIGYFGTKGDSITFTNVMQGSGIKLFYAQDENPVATLSVYINGAYAGKARMAASGYWERKFSESYFEADIPEGAEIALVYEEGDTGWVCLDYLEVAPVNAEPEVFPYLLEYGTAEKSAAVVTVAGNIYTITPTNENAELFYAVYEQSGNVLKRVKRESVTLAEENEQMPFSCDVDVSGIENPVVKVFLLNSIDAISPLAIPQYKEAE